MVEDSPIGAHRKTAAPAPAFWCGKRVLITGHTGFKGIWLSLWLQSLGATVFGYSTSSPSQREEDRLVVAMKSFQGDICDLKTLREALCTTRAEIVFHLAGQPLVQRAFHDPIGTYRTNVLGTATLLASVRRCATVRAVLVVTTDQCYKIQNLDRAYRESDLLGGSDPYSSSKACVELLVASFRDAFFHNALLQKNSMGIATARTGNVIGGGDWAPDRLIPQMMRSFAAGRPVTLRSPRAMRPWQHVLEVLRGYLLLIEHLYAEGSHARGAWNFGPVPADMRSVEWIAAQLSAAWGAEARWNLPTGSPAPGSPTLQLDCSRAAAELSWMPVLPLAQALALTVDWYRHFYTGNDVKKKYLDQIAAYSALLDPLRRADAEPRLLPENSGNR